MHVRRLILACWLSWVAGSATAAFAGEIVVAPGDNLWDLARAHGTTVAELMAANDLRSERLALGQVLRLPGSTPSIAYTVQPQDTLYSIARAHGVTVEALQAANGLSGTVIRPGQAARRPRRSSGGASDRRAAGRGGGRGPRGAGCSPRGAGCSPAAPAAAEAPEAAERVRRRAGVKPRSGSGEPRRCRRRRDRACGAGCGGGFRCT
jgi:LysM repeat protein